MIKFPLTKKFRATTFFKAFLLDSINVTLSSYIGFITHFYLHKNHNIPDWVTILITIIITFMNCLLINLIMFYLFAYGGGMLTTPKERKEYHLNDTMLKIEKKKSLSNKRK